MLIGPEQPEAPDQEDALAVDPEVALEQPLRRLLLLQDLKQLALEREEDQEADHGEDLPAPRTLIRTHNMPPPPPTTTTTSETDTG